MSGTTRVALITGLVALPLGALAWWLGSPLIIDRTVAEEFPAAGAAVVPEGMTRQEVGQVMTAMGKLDERVSEAMPPADTVPRVLKRGSFRDADDFHRGSGTATIYQLEDGSRVLRLEEFRVTNGPDLRVLLSSHPDPMSRDELTSAGYLELGKLKGNIGAQNYELTSDIDVDSQASVIIYCKPFHVIFSVAPLQPS